MPTACSVLTDTQCVYSPEADALNHIDEDMEAERSQTDRIILAIHFPFCLTGYVRGLVIPRYLAERWKDKN